ncbi:uncharacterized protein TRAVEDRAFT_58310 [Trametes versicolor FP-101664 SS1]|uniref:uncharacterized protein n=1 Tax=Trametes versicolor (strain FP-101664) TaxID=717944 RepID=UPI000462348F|nr:uncharacterized protein TRAVEDRAFT_58310 [Trametes versicolor FP-101664 SS1]EIW59509.1 hypothetical protein TRAVEDRAFT_58310 [Trametes versicolor FP-101664 SS1]
MMFPRPARIPFRLSPLSLPRLLFARHASKNSNPWPDVQGSADDQPKVRTWMGKASRISNFVIIPTVLLYAVFYADFGEHEHVFQPPRRWLQTQKASFFSLSPEEQKLAGIAPAKPAPSDDSAGAERS